jgi:hypothetical protein
VRNLPRTTRRCRWKEKFGTRLASAAWLIERPKLPIIAVLRLFHDA